VIIRITSIVLSLAGSIALIFGLLFWAGFAVNLISIHMLLGLLAVASLWVVGIGQAFAQTGSWMIAVCALVVGALTIVFGLYQSSMLVGSFHWVVQIVHLLLGILTIGLGHMATARYRKGVTE